MNDVVCVEEFLDKYRVCGIEYKIEEFKDSIKIILEVEFYKRELISRNHGIQVFTSNFEIVHYGQRDIVSLSDKKIQLWQVYKNIRKKDVESFSYTIDNKIIKTFPVERSTENEN